MHKWMMTVMIFPKNMRTVPLLLQQSFVYSRVIIIIVIISCPWDFLLEIVYMSHIKSTYKYNNAILFFLSLPLFSTNTLSFSLVWDVDMCAFMLYTIIYNNMHTFI